ncbi:cutinase family protein [Gordonia hongkongensis]|uniref:cutinase family protein n=1 Tax=Gordonia hongkongensis TaxID=1701090 RepID=UPI003EB937D4
MQSAPATHFVRQFVATVVAALTVATLGFISPPSPAFGADSIVTRCKPGGLIVVGLRGSGESFSDSYGAGPTVYSAYQYIKQSRGPNRPTDLVTINYPAPGIDKAIAAVLRGEKTYFNGVENGVSQLTSTISSFSRSTQCANTHVSIVGFSQGAMVAHRYIVRVGRAALDKMGVFGVLLIGDGDRRADDRYDGQYGTGFFPGPHWGISHGAPGVAGNLNPRTPITPGGKVRVVSACNAYDPICDFQTSRLALAGVALHPFQYVNSPFTRLAAIRVNGLPPTRPTGPIDPTPSLPNGKPRGDCGGRVESSSSPTFCMIFRQNTAIKADESNGSALITGYPLPSGVYDEGRLPAASKSYLRSLGVNLELIKHGDGTEEYVVSGTPTAPPGVYQYTVQERRIADGTWENFTWYVQIVPRTTPDA